jgi:hypothetical protein
MRRFEVLGVWWAFSGGRSGCGVIIVLVELPMSAFVFSSLSLPFLLGLVVLRPQHACIVWLLY